MCTVILGIWKAFGKLGSMNVPLAVRICFVGEKTDLISVYSTVISWKAFGGKEGDRRGF